MGYNKEETKKILARELGNKAGSLVNKYIDKTVAKEKSKKNIKR